MKKICLLLTFVFVMLLGVSALADMDVKELTVQFVPTNTETADATTAEFSAYMTELMGIPVKMTVATSYNAIVEAMESGTVDVGIMPPATYAQAREMGVAKAILSTTLNDYDENEQLMPGVPVGSFKAEVLVRADSGITGYEGLAGWRLPRRCLTRGAGRRWCARLSRRMARRPATRHSCARARSWPPSMTRCLRCTPAKWTTR